MRSGSTGTPVIVGQPAFASLLKHEQVRFIALTVAQVQLTRPEKDLAKLDAGEIRMQTQGELQDESLMPMSGRGRHEQLSVDELVARRHPGPLVDETLNFVSRPPARATDRHAHNLLGGCFPKQLGTTHHERRRANGRHRAIPVGSKAARARRPPRAQLTSRAHFSKRGTFLRSAVPRVALQSDDDHSRGIGRAIEQCVASSGSTK